MVNDLKLVVNDEWLEPWKRVILNRHNAALLRYSEIAGYGNKLYDKINSHLYYGLHFEGEEAIFREWAPNATNIWLIGDMNGWSPSGEFAFKKSGEGNWELRVPKQRIKHGDHYKWLIEWPGGSGERIPAYAGRVVQDPVTKIFSAQVWNPEPYKWNNARPPKPEGLLIYEAHIGMSSESEGVATYNYFRERVLPHISSCGYNAIQLMAIQEHPYYGSFGYQVSSFFAPSSRFGTPEELKMLIDKAHSLGIIVILDLVHSHAVINVAEGLSEFDGTNSQYFHDGERGYHPAWNSRCFDYGKEQVLRFLLSNCKYWLEEYMFDGFRFDGVTSMIYYDHGLGKAFTDYSDYFGGNQDDDALIYLTLANRLIEETYSDAVTIAEDVSGMPGLAAPYEWGGIGFGYRMSMGVADSWIRWIKERRDEDWNMGEIFRECTEKRADEKTISYAECHDQALVGDKTIIFRLTDKEMYFSMSDSVPNLTVERGIALHKMIRAVTMSLAGNGYLNFMGNEFGHPEWIDFPREGNGWSYFYARRQWSLIEDQTLKYRYLLEFDKAMVAVAKGEQIFSSPVQLIFADNNKQVLSFSRAGLIYIFNFTPQVSYTDYKISAPEGEYRIVLDSDNRKFGGFGRNDEELSHFTQLTGNNHMLSLYLPARSAIVLKRVN